MTGRFFCAVDITTVDSSQSLPTNTRRPGANQVFRTIYCSLPRSFFRALFAAPFFSAPFLPRTSGRGYKFLICIPIGTLVPCDLT